jgi:hypothetical protein
VTTTRDRFYALRLFARGVRPPVERVTGNRIVAHPLTNEDRADLWRAKYKRVPVERRNKAVSRDPRAVFVQRQQPEPLHVVVPLKRRA